ncbi:MAG: MBL fold metallo-hydrolase [Gammaproteobacteria bacterium]|nr:MBL fold metallo-hydrolase [Gammaproteobacteria bacterium]
MVRNKSASLLATACLLLPAVAAPAVDTNEFCLDGEFDLGARYQGLRPVAGEFYPTSWCVITEGNSGRVMFSGSGKSNPDMDGDWTVAYLPPNLVRIVNRTSPPDVEFHGAAIDKEIARIRRMDPRRLAAEIAASDGGIEGLEVTKSGDRIARVSAKTDMPLRGLVEVDWLWDWEDASAPSLRIVVDGDVFFRATGRWRTLESSEAAELWERTEGEAPVEVDGERWPSAINMRLIELDDGVYLVRGVRTGFQHLVVDTSEGLVVGDAPAGWVEFHHLPPTDLAPGLGSDGLSHRFIEFLGETFPGRPIHAVALTHAHDDHAGGARAFADSGARVFAPQELASFFDEALDIRTIPIRKEALIGSEENRVRLVPMGPGPHADSMLGVWAVDRDWFFVSDVHVPNSDAAVPRPERAITECWFAAWAVDNLPETTRVVNSHSAPQTPVSRLADYLASEECGM